MTSKKFLGKINSKVGILFTHDEKVMETRGEDLEIRERRLESKGWQLRNNGMEI